MAASRVANPSDMSRYILTYQKDTNPYKTMLLSSPFISKIGNESKLENFLKEF